MTIQLGRMVANLEQPLIFGHVVLQDHMTKWKHIHYSTFDLQIWQDCDKPWAVCTRNTPLPFGHMVLKDYATN